ncbi:MAG: arylesterase [Candidatus Sericytochromatia bacterium]
MLLLVGGSTPVSAAASETVILMLGDSLTEGTGVAPEKAYPKLVEQQLRREGYRIKVINAGIGGSTTASAPARLRWHLRAKPRPQIVLLALGPNDGMRGVPVSQSQAALAQTIELARSQQLKVVLAGMQIPPNYGPSYTRSFAAMYPALAKKYQLPLVPFLLQGVAAQPQLNLADGIHPNAAGHALLARNVLPYLRPLLRKAA